MLAALCVILAIFFMYQIAQIAGAPDKENTQKSGTGLNQFSKEDTFPYLKKTPMRERLWSKLEYATKTNARQRLIDFIYMRYCQQLLYFCEEPAEKILSGAGDSAMVQRLDSEEVFLYFLSYYTYAIGDIMVTTLKTRLPKEIYPVFSECEDLFLKDYASVYNVSYDNLKKFHQVKKSEYAGYAQGLLNYARESGGLEKFTNGIEPVLRDKLVEDIMTNVLHSDSEEVRIRIAGYVFAHATTQLPQASKEVWSAYHAARAIYLRESKAAR